MANPLANPLEDFFSWHEISTFAGSIAATMVILRFITMLQIEWLAKRPAVAEAYVIAATLLIAADIFLPGDPSAETIGLALINAVIVAISATGANVALDGLIPDSLAHALGKREPPP